MAQTRARHIGAQQLHGVSDGNRRCGTRDGNKQRRHHVFDFYFHTVGQCLELAENQIFIPIRQSIKTPNAELQNFDRSFCIGFQALEIRLGQRQIACHQKNPPTA